MSKIKSDTILASHRAQIDTLDQEIIDLLAKRMDVVREVGELKAEYGISPTQPARIEEVVEKSRQRGLEKGLDPDFVEQFYRMMIDHAIAMEFAIKESSVDE